MKDIVNFADFANSLKKDGKITLEFLEKAVFDQIDAHYEFFEGMGRAFEGLNYPERSTLWIALGQMGKYERESFPDGFLDYFKNNDIDISYIENHRYEEEAGSVREYYCIFHEGDDMFCAYQYADSWDGAELKIYKCKVEPKTIWEVKKID